jgi:hypothetical protein
MPGRPKDHALSTGERSPAVALSELGRLRIVDDGSPISSNEAKVLIAVEFERTSGSARRMSGRIETAVLPTATAAGEDDSALAAGRRARGVSYRVT